MFVFRSTRSASEKFSGVLYVDLASSPFENIASFGTSLYSSTGDKFAWDLADERMLPLCTLFIPLNSDRLEDFRSFSLNIGS